MKKTSTETNALLLDNQLCFALYSANLAVNKLYRQLLAAWSEGVGLDIVGQALLMA